MVYQTTRNVQFVYLICSNHFSRWNTVVHILKGKEGIVFLPNNKTKHVKKLYSNMSKDKVLEVSCKINGQCTYVLTSHNINETITTNNGIYSYIFLLTRSSLGKCTSCTSTIACFYFVFASKWTTFYLFGDTRVRLEKPLHELVGYFGQIVRFSQYCTHYEVSTDLIEHCAWKQCDCFSKVYKTSTVDTIFF